MTCASGGVHPPGTARRSAQRLTAGAGIVAHLGSSHDGRAHRIHVAHIEARETQAEFQRQQPTISIDYLVRRQLLMADMRLPEHCPPASPHHARSRFPLISRQGLPELVTGLTTSTTGTGWQSTTVSTSTSLRGLTS